jgi:hypothetical protein
MLDNRNIHMKIQEMCDCYATSDPLKAMSDMATDTSDPQSDAEKWLALAVLHGINSNAEKITIGQDRKGDVHVSATYRRTTLPAPHGSVAEAIIGAVRKITHIDNKKGKLPISIGIGNSSVDIEMKVKTTDGQEKISLKMGQ